MTGHPYAPLEGSPTWDVLDRALAQLEANGDVALSTARLMSSATFVKPFGSSGVSRPPPQWRGGYFAAPAGC